MQDPRMTFNKTTLAPGITAYSNVIPDPQGLISKIERAAVDNHITWSPGQVGHIDATKEVKKTEIATKFRVVDVIGLPAYDRGPVLGGTPEKLMMHLTLNELLLPVVKDYGFDHRCLHAITGENWQILRYGEGHFFEDHVDDSKIYPRTCSISYYINDRYEGGEIEFSRFNLKIKPEANQAIVFPANYVYNHKVHPVTSGVRWAIVNWFE